jgi:hypothetical protein
MLEDQHEKQKRLLEEKRNARLAKKRIKELEVKKL